MNDGDRQDAKVPNRYSSSWKQSALDLVKGEYHIVHDGILTRRDFSLLFESDETRRRLPVETMKQINVYSDVQIAPSALSLLSKHGVRIAFFDLHGNLQGFYTPYEACNASEGLSRQYELCAQPSLRLEYAKEFERAAFRSMLATVKYYRKVGCRNIDSQIDAIEGLARQVGAAGSVNGLMLVEARARSSYYACFDAILEGSDFAFGARSKRPPKNEVNAMISFGNAILYNKLLQIIWRAGLDPKMGIVHSSRDRAASLHLDFADVFKPLIVDRVVFSLINRREVKRDRHFRGDEQATFLNDEGKRIIVERIGKKLSTQITAGGRHLSYSDFMALEVRKFRDAIFDGELYEPLRLR